MQPEKLIDWSITIVICVAILSASVAILSATGIQDWIAKLTGNKYTKKELEEKLSSLESRIEKIEKSQDSSHTS